MKTHSYPTRLLLAPALVLVAAAAGAQQGGMTSPPWGDNGARIEFGDEKQGVVQIQYKGQFRMTLRDEGSGLEGEGSTASFGFRRNRLALMGGWADKVGLYVQTEFNEDMNVDTLGVADQNTGTEFQLLDAVVRLNLAPAFKLSVGKFKYNLSRENLESCEEPLTLDRSLFIRPAYVSTRSQGIALWGNLLGAKLQYRVDAMEGRKAVSGVAAPDSSLRYGARAHVTLLEPESAYGYKGTYLGGKNVLTIGGAFQYEADVAYVDVVNRLGSEDYQAWTVDAFFEHRLGEAGTVTASAAYEKVDIGDAYLGTNPDPGAIGLYGEKNGWFAKGGYLFGGVPLQLFGRFEKWRFAQLNNVYDQMVDWYGVGVSYYVWGQNLKLSAEWSKTDFDQEGVHTSVQGTSQTSRDFNTFVAQLQFIF